MDRDRRSCVRTMAKALALPALAGSLLSTLALASCDGNADGTGGARDLKPAIPVTATSASASTGIVGVGGGGPGLYEVSLGHRPGKSPVVATVGENVLGITVVATATDGVSDVTFESVESPAGEPIIDGSLTCNQASWTRPLMASIALPQVDSDESFPVAGGDWTFGLSTDSSEAAVSMWVRATADGAFHGGVIDVNVFMSGAYTSKDHVRTALAAAFTDFGGLELGDVHFYNPGGDFVEITDDNIAAALEATTVAETRPAINVIATRQIVGAHEGSMGFSTGIPGAPMSPGSRQSAIVWMVQNDDAMDASVLRHEAGHFAGLFHTSEFMPGLGDPLADTPLCEDAAAEFSECPDFDYTMFPSGGSGLGLFSASETAIIHASALYRGVYAEGEDPMTPYGPSMDNDPIHTDGDDAGGTGDGGFGEPGFDGPVAPSGGSPGNASYGWREGLTASQLGLLIGIGCPDPSGRTLFDALDAAGAPSVDRLLALAESASAPAMVRRRALFATARASASGNRARDASRRLENLVFDGTAPDIVRSGALEALTTIDVDRAHTLSADLDERVPVIVATRTRLGF